MATYHRKLIELKVLDEETLLTAKEEIEDWHSHPHAFNMLAMILVSGKV